MVADIYHYYSTSLPLTMSPTLARVTVAFCIVTAFTLAVLIYVQLFSYSNRPPPIPAGKSLIRSSFLKGNMTSKFPKIVHYMWKSSQVPTPAETVRWRQGCEAVNPDHEFRMYYDSELSEFVEKHYPEYLSLFKSLKGVYMADMARVLLVYHYGGTYLDLDFYCYRPLSCLEGMLPSEISPAKDLLVVSLEPKIHANIFRDKDRVVIQDFYMATPKHPFLKWFLDDRLAQFTSRPAADKQGMKGPFSYSIEKDIDAYWSHMVSTGAVSQAAAVSLSIPRRSSSTSSSNNSTTSSSSSNSNNRVLLTTAEGDVKYVRDITNGRRLKDNDNSKSGRGSSDKKIARGDAGRGLGGGDRGGGAAAARYKKNKNRGNGDRDSVEGGSSSNNTSSSMRPPAALGGGRGKLGGPQQQQGGPQPSSTSSSTTGSGASTDSIPPSKDTLTSLLSGIGVVGAGGAAATGPGKRPYRNRKSVPAAGGSKSVSATAAAATAVINYGVIVELPADITHPLIDQTNSRLYSKCANGWTAAAAVGETTTTKSINSTATTATTTAAKSKEKSTSKASSRRRNHRGKLPVPPWAVEACHKVKSKKYFEPTDRTIAVHMWTHTYLGWNFIRGIFNSAIYEEVENKLPPSLKCPNFN